MTGDTTAQYFDIRARIIDTVTGLRADQLDDVVPACPAWSVRQLLAHVVAMPLAIVAGDLPEAGNPGAWIQRLVDDNAHRAPDDLLAWWASDDQALGDLARSAALLVTDLFVHEGDLHGAVGSPGHRNAPELGHQLQASLDALRGPLTEADLAPIRVTTPEGHFATGDGEPGWTLDTSAWEAHRVLNSRRTSGEIVATGGDGDPTPYLAVLDAHLPLPASSLGERSITG